MLMHKCMYIQVNMCFIIHVCMYACVSVCVDMFVCVYICKYVYVSFVCLLFICLLNFFLFVNFLSVFCLFNQSLFANCVLPTMYKVEAYISVSLLLQHFSSQSVTL